MRNLCPQNIVNVFNGDDGDVNVFRIKNILLCVYLFDFLKREHFGNSRWANKYTQALKTFLELCVHSIFFSLSLKKEFIVETASKCLVKVKWRQQVQESVILYVIHFSCFSVVISVCGTSSHCTFVVPFSTDSTLELQCLCNSNFVCFLSISAEEKPFLVSLSIPWLPPLLSPRNRYNNRTVLKRCD